MPVQAEPSYEKLTPPTFKQNRDISGQIHAFLRHLIIDEVLASGTTLNQANLARRLGVSRIPMREAFRMLQQEGLIDVSLNQRARIRKLSATEVDNLYGIRIALESLAARVTAGRLSEGEVARGRYLLVEMGAALARGDIAFWVDAHREFHGICTARANEPLSDLITSFSERSERYVRLVHAAHPAVLVPAQREHDAILTAVAGGRPHAAAALMAEHLSHTATMALNDIDPNYRGEMSAQAHQMATTQRDTN